MYIMHVYYGTELLSYSYMHVCDIHVVLQSVKEKNSKIQSFIW